jgi:hypothetical protein
MEQSDLNKYSECLEPDFIKIVGLVYADTKVFIDDLNYFYQWHLYFLIFILIEQLFVLAKRLVLHGSIEVEREVTQK